MIEFAGIGVPPPIDPDRPTKAELQEARQQLSKVYFIYSCNRIRIGTSTDYVRRITSDIMPYCPAPIHLVRTINGGKLIEARMHRRFGPAWRDDWFGLTPELRAYLNEDEAGAERLADAEEDYRDWLLCEMEDQEDGTAVRDSDTDQDARSDQTRAVDRNGPEPWAPQGG